ncbi:alpha/beta fold hydrolase [Lewinella sp. JB7]|uniref:alpha/beta fold hydrolase n=1 Tax=Lewinella sp. JB7 TaxID=2962887 RepID=UPI0020C951BD|nr:alpha/beta fold hydrolase [Lewinella sp. JB7]MCP9234972.1 alpha/beta fold hydrolase [Lewinella sp. JB7]
MRTESVYTSLVIALVLLFAARSSAQSDAPVNAPEFPLTIRKVKLNDTLQLAYTDVGQARDGILLFVHGLGSNLRAWDKTIAGLSDRFRCVAVDLPGYGHSSREKHPATVTYYADQVEAFIRELGLPSLTLIGHSMGGQIALELASRRPGWLERLVLAAPAGLETFSEQDRQFFATYVRPEFIQALTPAQIEANFDLNFHGGTPADARFMIDDRMTLREDSAAYTQYTHLIAGSVAGMLAGPVRHKLGEVSVPTLVVFGHEDRLIPNQALHPGLTVKDVGMVAVRGIPRVRVEYLHAAGHFVQWDRAAGFNDLVRAFMAEEK